jgi:hypothetical protein
MKFRSDPCCPMATFIDDLVRAIPVEQALMRHLLSRGWIQWGQA